MDPVFVILSAVALTLLGVAIMLGVAFALDRFLTWLLPRSRGH